MFVFSRLFRRKEQRHIPPIPPWEEIVEHMQGKGLSGFIERVSCVIISKDCSKRIVILQSENGYYKAVFEEIRVFDEDEWIYFCNAPGGYPAWWEPVDSSINNKSFYGTEEDAIKAVTDSHEYKTYFV